MQLTSSAGAFGRTSNGSFIVSFLIVQIMGLTKSHVNHLPDSRD